MVLRLRSWCGRSASALTLPLLVSAVFQAGQAQAAPDRIWYNGDVHTSDLSSPAAQAFAIEDGKFVAVGSDKEVRVLADEDTVLMDLNGKTVLPGIIDSHFHLFSWYEISRGVDMTGVNDVDVWVDKVKQKAKEIPAGGWIVGGGWDHNAVGGVFPTASQLDEVAPDHLVALGDIDHHTMWVNSKVLEKFNITADTPSPFGGEIVKDPETGEPTGILKETAAMMVWGSEAFLPKKTERMNIWKGAIAHMNSLGITGMHNMGDASEMDDLIELVEADELSIRMWYGPMVHSGKAVEELLPKYTAINERASKYQSKGPRFAFGFIKGVTDGVLSSRTAVLEEEYSDAPGEHGKFFIEPSEAKNIVRVANAANIPVALHAIGDEAVHEALDAFEASPRQPDLLNRIEHIEVMLPEDLPRFQKLNVVASMQPQHAVGSIDPYVVQRIGSEREEWAYTWQKILKSGAKLAFSSDWPTSSANPLAQLHGAVTRQSLDGTPKGGWHVDQALTFDEALYAMTEQGAELSGWEKEIGSISTGKWADFVILDSPVSMPVDLNILDINVEATFIAGDAVYRKSESNK